MSRAFYWRRCIIVAMSGGCIWYVWYGVYGVHVCTVVWWYG